MYKKAHVGHEVFNFEGALITLVVGIDAIALLLAHVLINTPQYWKTGKIVFLLYAEPLGYFDHVFILTMMRFITWLC